MKVLAGTTYTVPAGTALLVVDKLILEKGATVEIPSSSQLFTIRAKTSSFAENTSIVAIGANGGTGESGHNGVSLHLYLGETTFLGTVVNTSGGQGGQGVAGGKGRDGGAATCPDIRGGNGAQGGKGGTGGNGGNGGNIFVYTSRPTLPTNLLLLPAGGRGGAGGHGGSSVECGAWPLTWYLRGGYNGAEGSIGDSGQDGIAGQAHYNQLANSHVSAHIEQILELEFSKDFIEPTIRELTRIIHRGS